MFKPFVCMQTNSKCYKETWQIAIKGVLWHSTGANNPYLWRYVQPSDDDPNYDLAIKKIGKNNNGNDWNHAQVDAGLNAFIGKFEDGSVGTAQTMPWDFRPWGCGKGVNGSCNNGWLQFEICEDDLKDKAYAEKVFEEGCQLTAYICRMFRLDPDGKVLMDGVSVPVITCHNDAAKLGLASDHADINHWFPKLIGKGMSDVRARVKEILKDMQTYEEYITKMPSRGYYLLGDGYKTNTDLKPQIKELQSFLVWALGIKLSVSGKYGSATKSAVKEFQRKVGITEDGSWGEKTLAAARGYKK